MAQAAFLVLSVLVVLVRQGEMAATPKTIEFEYGGDQYWIDIDVAGGVNFEKARLACQEQYEGEITTITSDHLYTIFQTRVIDNMPSGKKKVTLWTGDSRTAGTHVLLVIWRARTGKTNSKVDRELSYEALGCICRKKVNPPGRSYYFEYENEDYWFHINHWGSFNLSESEAECQDKYLAEVVRVMTEQQCSAIQKQIEYRIPTNWTGVTIWTANSDSEGTNKVMAIWNRMGGAGGPNRGGSVTPGYRGNGYICHRRKNLYGKTYDFEHNGDMYWFKIDQSKSTKLADAQKACYDEHSADVMIYYNDEQFTRVLKQIEYRVPTDMVDATLWTNDTATGSPGSFLVLVISGEATGRTDDMWHQPPNYHTHGYVCQMKVNKPGTTYQFDFQGKSYWFKMELVGTFDYSEATTNCMNDHDASLASASDTAAYAEMQARIRFRIPELLDEVMIWISDGELDANGTHTMLVVTRTMGGVNTKEKRKTSLNGHGYICQKSYEVW